MLAQRWVESELGKICAGQRTVEQPFPQLQQVQFRYLRPAAEECAQRSQRLVARFLVCLELAIAARFSFLWGWAEAYRLTRGAL